MAADPEPDPRVTDALGDNAIFQADSRGIKILIAVKRLEIQRGMVGIFLKNSEGFFRRRLNLFWQLAELPPKL